MKSWFSRLVAGLVGSRKQGPEGATFSEIAGKGFHWTEDEDGLGLAPDQAVFVPLFGRGFMVYVHPEVEEVTQPQFEALQRFLQLGRDSREETALSLALDYYQMSDSAESAKTLQRPADVWRLVDLEGLTIPRHGRSRDHYVFVWGECRWDDHGLLVVFRNGRLSEVRHGHEPLSADYPVDYVGRFESILLGNSEAKSENRHPDAASQAAEPSAGVSEEPDSRVRSLIELLQDESPSVRDQAAWGLSRLGPAAKAAVPALSALLRAPETNVRDAAARALGRIGPAAKTAIPVLFELARENDLWAREMIGYIAGQIGSAAIPILIYFLRDEKPTLRVLAARELVGIDPSTISPLADLLRDADPAVWVDASFALTTLSRAAAPSVARLLESPETRVRAAAAVALGKMPW
ncbi:MAG: HEAT repeat domain-containing protein [Planctomycetota bacterium]